jgi:hypothetical protein
VEKEWTIQPNFKIPKGCNRTFICWINGVRHEIKADRERGLSYKVDVARNVTRLELSQSLDWSQEVVERIRQHCGG